MANSINYASVFNRILDEKFYIMPRTAWMENTDPSIVWDNGKYVKIPKLSMDGLGDMQGYKAPSGDLSLVWETKALDYYRGRDFEIGRYDVDETNFALSAGNALKVFLGEQVVPEIDKIRIMRVAQSANNDGTIKVEAQSGLTSANIVGKLLADITAVQDKIGEDEQLYIQINQNLKGLVEASTEISKFLAVREMGVRGVNLKVESLNEQFLIGTPSSYMKSAFVLNDGRTAGQTIGGVSYSNTAPAVNWIISAKKSVDAIARPQISKVITPDENQLGDFWKIMFSVHHGIWTMDNKLDGILVSLDNTMGTLTVSSTAGESGKTIIAIDGAVPSEDTKYAYKVDNSATSTAVGTAVAGWTDWDGVSQITATSGKTITVALVGKDSNKPLATGSATVVAGS